MDLCEAGVEIEVENVEEVVNPILGAKTPLVMLFELRDDPSVFWSCAWRLGDGSKGAARLDSVEVDVLLVAVDLFLARLGRAWCD